MNDFVNRLKASLVMFVMGLSFFFAVQLSLVLSELTLKQANEYGLIDNLLDDSLWDIILLKVELLFFFMIPFYGVLKKIHTIIDKLEKKIVAKK